MKPTADEFNIACDMEPVSVFDATAHSNSEWPDKVKKVETRKEAILKMLEVMGYVSPEDAYLYGGEIAEGVVALYDAGYRLKDTNND